MHYGLEQTRIETAMASRDICQADLQTTWFLRLPDQVFASGVRLWACPAPKPFLPSRLAAGSQWGRWHPRIGVSRPHAASRTASISPSRHWLSVMHVFHSAWIWLRSSGFDIPPLITAEPTWIASSIVDDFQGSSVMLTAPIMLRQFVNAYHYLFAHLHCD